MYKVYSDNNLLYSSNLENLKIVNPSLEVELNKTGSFVFDIYPDHPYFSRIKKMKSIITVYQSGHTLFRGRVLDEEIGWHNQKTLTCEGDLAFLIDSVIRPFSITGTPENVLTYAIAQHNAQVDTTKQFRLGNVTVEGTLTIDLTEHTNTLEVLQKHLLEAFGGYLMTRTLNDVTYLDYLSEITRLAPQSITFGKNLLDLKRIQKGADIATVIIPLGAFIKDEEGNETTRRLTVEAVNGGFDYVQNDDAITQFGRIVKSVIFEDITDASVLLLKGQSYLADSINLSESIEMTAADLAALDVTLASFQLGTKVDVKSKAHGLDQSFIVSKLSLKLLDPAANTLVLGKAVSTFSESVAFEKGDPGRDGANGKDGSTGVGVASVTGQYYLSTSATALAGGSWSNNVPTLVNGRFMWTKFVTAYTNGTSSETKPMCVSGALNNGEGKVLWSGSWYMTAGHTANLSEKITDQVSGVVLVFSKYENSAVADNNFQFFFVPKTFINSFKGYGCTFVMAANRFVTVATKYLYINDAYITGHADNNLTGTANGITFNNASFVMRYVIGV